MTVLIKQILVGVMENYAYIFACMHSRKALLIDPCAETDQLLAELEKRDLELVGLVNTHGHADHVAGNKAILNKHDVPVYAHRKAEFRAQDPISQQIFHALQGQAPDAPSHLLDDGDEIKVGEQSLQVIHAPGHTSGDILLYWPGDEEQAAFVITGDVLFVGAIGRTDLPGSSDAQMQNSLATKIAPLDDATRVFPGHHYGPRPSSTIAAEKRSNPYLIEAMRAY